MQPTSSSVADFEVEAQLDPTIQFPHPIVTNISRPGKIFLTGATGLLGANLLGEFLRKTAAVVYCLVRSKGIDDGRTRLRQRLQFYALWNQSFESRIVPLVGDLEQPRFGLSETQFRTLAESADVIYHCGANVNLLYPYKRLKAVNVLGTQEVLRLAGQFWTKPVHYISTLSLFSPRGDGSGKKRVVLETEHPEHDGTLNSGYLKTKMVSEQLIQNAKERGLPACIYRTVRIIGQSDTGIMGSVGDMICLSWRGCVLIERSPVVERKLNLIPVDFASHAIAHLSRKPESMGRVFHISNPQTVSWAEIFEATRAFGYLVEPISYDQWLETIVERAQMTHDRDKKETMEMMALAHFAPKLFSRGFDGTYDMRQTLEGLSGTSIACPKIGDRLLRAYIAFFEESGFFPPARAKANIVEYWRRLSEARRVSRVKLLASSLASNAVRRPGNIAPRVQNSIEQISEERQREAVRLAETTNRSAVDIAREFGVPLHEFYAWRKHFNRHRSTNDLRLGKALGVQVPLKTVFEHPTVEALAGWVGKALEEGEKEEKLRELQRAERGREALLSYAQRRMWFLDQLDPGSVSYTVPNSIQFHGELEPDKLEAALSEIVRRHESLRTTFLSREGEPFQIIYEAQPVRIALVDFSALPPSERHEAARQRAREQSRQPWDLKNGPLFRVQLIRTAPDEHLLILTMHHIITDGRSMGILAQELGVLYRAFARNRPSPLSAPPLQYADFAIWQRDWLRGNLLEKQLSYWRTRLADLQEIELPTDFPRPKVHRYRGGRASFSISRTTTNSLNALARSVGATPFMTLLAGFDVFLAMISGQRDICVGTPVANRNTPELENIIGFFVNTLVMRAQIEGDPTFQQFLKQVRERCLEAFDHWDLPFEKLVDELSPARDLSRHPLFQVMFVHREGAQGVELPGISFRQRAAEMETSNFDLLFVTSETAEGYDGMLQYNSDLFRQETIARFVDRFAVVFERLAAAPDLPLSQISPFVGNELDSILEWSQGPSVPAGSRLIQDWLARHAQAAPARLVAETEWGSLTYGELDRLSNQLAHSLREDGLGPDRIAGLCVERSPEMLVGLFGILKAGGAFLAIDPEYPDERISLMLEDAAVQIVVAQDTFRDRLEALVPNGAIVVHSLDRKEAWNDRGDEPPPLALRPEDLAYVIFSSGSTGRPKGVLVEHRNAVYVIEAQLAPFGIDSSSRVLQMLSLSFDAALGEIFRAISAGATLFFAPRDQLMPGPGLVALMRERHITAVALPPTVLGALPTEAAQQLPELRTLTVGGEACPPHLAKRWGEGRRMVSGYGPTETTIGATVAVDWDLDMKPPLGGPLANATIHVLDGNMRPVPVGVPGELFIGGAGVTRGYLNRAELTAEVFVPDPFSDEPGRRLYSTGDRARWLADGQLDFLGRKDFQVKIRGFRIEPGEIAAVAQRHGAVDQCVVDVREDRGVRRLIGYARRKNEGKTVSSAELRAFVNERLPDYMVPSVFVFIATIPMTVNGKVDYKNLPQPNLNTLVSEMEYVAPRNDLEERLAKIWQQVLGIEKVGVHANFFELGGDSILSIQMIARATEMGITFSVRDVFEHQTIAELALVAERGAASEADQVSVTSEVPLTPIQHWYFEQNSGEPAHFNHSMTLPANPAVFRDGLVETALRALCEHHDALRARFRRDQDGHWKQIFAEPGDVPVIERYDLSASSEQERKTTIEERREAAHQALNLEDGPIFRVLLFNFGSGVPGRMVLIVHHLVTDIVSWQILVQDLMTAIQKIANGGNPQFPPKTTSYRRWAELLVKYAKSPELKSQVDHWLDPMRLDVGRLPVDFPVGKNDRSASAKYTGSLDEDETRRLTESLPRRAGVKVLDILVTALAETLCRWSGHPRIVIDLEGHGREEIGSEKLNLSRTIGWFTSFYPALLELPASDDLRDSLSETARRLDAVPSRGLGYGVIRYLLSDEIVRGRLSSLPRAEVAFNYTGHGGHGHGPRTNESEALSLDIGQIMLSQSAKRPRLHLFEIVAGVANGRLVVRWGYSTNTYAAETVAHVSERFLQNLRRLLARLDDN